MIRSSKSNKKKDFSYRVMKVMQAIINNNMYLYDGLRVASSMRLLAELHVFEDNAAVMAVMRLIESVLVKEPLFIRSVNMETSNSGNHPAIINETELNQRLIVEFALSYTDGTATATMWLNDDGDYYISGASITRRV